MKIAVAGSSGTVGRHVVRCAKRRGHGTARLSRTDGVDLTSGHGLDAALAGVDVVIDVTNAGTTDEAAATEFFVTVAGNLQRSAAAAAGVRRIVTLSIVGVDDMPFGYYNAKLAHERVTRDGSVPGVVLRATQFHEFAPQILLATLDGDRASVLDVAVQPVAAESVAATLIEAAEDTQEGRVRDIAGPERADLVAVARRFVAHHGLGIDVAADPDSVAGLPTGAMLANLDARLIGPSFEEWLHSPASGEWRSRFDQVS